MVRRGRLALDLVTALVAAPVATPASGGVQAAPADLSVRGGVTVMERKRESDGEGEGKMEQSTATGGACRGGGGSGNGPSP